MKFTWNTAKAKSNYAKHGISFDLAKRVFQDPFAIEFLDDQKDYGEERFVMLGMAAGYILYVAFVERNGSIRMISARRATKYEQEIYFEENR